MFRLCAHEHATRAIDKARYHCTCVRLNHNSSTTLSQCVSSCKMLYCSNTQMLSNLETKTRIEPSETFAAMHSTVRKSPKVDSVGVSSVAAARNRTARTPPTNGRPRGALCPLASLAPRPSRLCMRVQPPAVARTTTTSQAAGRRVIRVWVSPHSPPHVVDVDLAHDAQVALLVTVGEVVVPCAHVVVVACTEPEEGTGV